MIGKSHPYSFNWAEAVVNAHAQEHSRATGFVWEIYKMSTPKLADLILRGSPWWRGYKKLVAFAEIWLAEVEGSRGRLTYPFKEGLAEAFQEDWDRLRAKVLPPGCLQELSNSLGKVNLDMHRQK